MFALRGWQFRTFVHSPAAMLPTLTSHAHEVVFIHWEPSGSCRHGPLVIHRHATEKTGFPVPATTRVVTRSGRRPAHLHASRRHRQRRARRADCPGGGPAAQGQAYGPRGLLAGLTESEQSGRGPVLARVARGTRGRGDLGGGGEKLGAR